MNPIETARLRSEYTRLIRDFFHNRNYLEVETPLLAPRLLPEPAIEVFASRYLNGYGREEGVYLIPSPELWMKRLLARGSGSLFQICKCFRNGESLEKYHNPEFTMLEWYTVNSDYLEAMEFMEALLQHLQNSLPTTRLPRYTFPIPRIAMRDAFKEILAVDLDELWDKEALFSQAQAWNLLCSREDTWEQLFNLVFINFIEPGLANLGAVFLYNYPAGIVTYAKRSSDPHYVERWELYLSGLEIANCYSEETNPSQLTALIAEERARKEEIALVTHAIDWGLPACFKEGFPPCAGAALGVDRLFMRLFGLTSIERALLFPFHDFF